MTKTRQERHKRRLAETDRGILRKIGEAYNEQRDEIGDSDLYNEQPVRLEVWLTLGEARRARTVAHQEAA